MQNETADAGPPAARAEESRRIPEASPPEDRGDAGYPSAGQADAGQADGAAEQPEQAGAGQADAGQADAAAGQRERRPAGQPDGGADPAAGRGAAPARSATGEPRVDAALRALDGLDQVPVTGHPEIFEDVHARIQHVLGELESGSAGSGSRRAG